MKKHVVRIPAVGTYVDGGIGGHYIEDWHQRRMIEDAKRRWKESIQAPLQLRSRIRTEKTAEHPVPWMEYYNAPNPYYGMKEEQLKIVIEKKPKNLWN